MSILEILKSSISIAPNDGQKLDKLRADLELAELRQRDAYAAIGDAVAAELPTEDASAKHDLEVKRVRALTSAISVVEQRIDAANQRGQAENRERLNEAFRNALEDVQNRAKSIQKIFDMLPAETTGLLEAIEAAGVAGRTAGNDSLAYRLGAGKSAFEFYLKNSSKHMPGCAVGYRESLVPYDEQFPRPNEVI